MRTGTEHVGAKGYVHVKVAKGSPIKPAMDNDTRCIGSVSLTKKKGTKK